MRTTIPLLGLLAAATTASTVAAQPAPPPCRVVVARAPDDVRAAIEEWVQRETSCGVTVDVRAVPTEGGYYLIARDEDGRLHERIVPDAATAGVLVASWVANWDPDPPPEPAAAVEPLPAPESAAEPAEDTTPVPAPRHGNRWLALDAMAGAGEAGSLVGVRGELDVLVGRRWRLGVAGLVGQGSMSLDAMTYVSSVNGFAQTSDYQVLAYVTREIRLGVWRVRPMFGLGEMFTTAHIGRNEPPPGVAIPNTGIPIQSVGITSTFAELSLRVAHDLGEGWGLEGGVLVDLAPQNYLVTPADPPSQAMSLVFEQLHRAITVGLVVGVRRRL